MLALFEKKSLFSFVQ